MSAAEIGCTFSLLTCVTASCNSKAPSDTAVLLVELCFPSTWPTCDESPETAARDIASITSAAFASGGGPPNVPVHRECAIVAVEDTSQSTSIAKPSGASLALPRRTHPPPSRGVISRTTWPHRQSTSGSESPASSQPRSIASLAPERPRSPPTYRLPLCGTESSSSHEPSAWRVPYPCVASRNAPIRQSSSQSARALGAEVRKPGVPWSRRRALTSRVVRVAARPPGPRPISKSVALARPSRSAWRRPYTKLLAATPPPTTAMRTGAGIATRRARGAARSTTQISTTRTFMYYY
eukprot:scaffold288985_cov35-Tisochrysis_lutea.AAC.2